MRLVLSEWVDLRSRREPRDAAARRRHDEALFSARYAAARSVVLRYGSACRRSGVVAPNVGSKLSTSWVT
jgi:hypothetical protein